MLLHMVADKVAGMVADKDILADKEFDIVADKVVAKLADMVAGHGGWLIGPKKFRLACLLSFASLFPYK